MSLYNKIYQRSPVAFQNFMVSVYGYSWKNRRFGGIFEDELRKAKERESFTKEQWNNYQQEQLTKLLLHSFNGVEFYNTSFKKTGLTVKDLKNITLDRLHVLPTMTKQDFRAFGMSTLVAAKREPKGKFFPSSGTTGTPTFTLFSYPMHQRWSAVFEARIRNWAGVNRFMSRGMVGGRRVLPGAYPKAPFYRYNFFEKQVYFSAFHINSASVGSYVEGINKYGVEYMTGYAMTNGSLAHFIKESGLQVNQQKAVITSSEKLTPEMRGLFKEVYGCKTYDSWSGIEACGLISECEHGSLHISPDAGIIELLDDNLQPVPVGTLGEVYCTGLLNFDQPLIRYPIGDAMALSGELCACKRNMPVIKEIAGRIEEVVIGTDGREIVRFQHITNGLKTVAQSQIIQHEIGKITIKVIPVGNDVSEVEKQMMKERTRGLLGDTELIIEVVPEIPLTENGKFKLVISTVKRKVNSK